MVSCSGGDSFEKEKTDSSSELAVTELESSSDFNSAASSSASESIEKTIETTNATIIIEEDTNSIEEITSKTIETTTVPSTKG
jgi:hypothetical protein